MPLPNAQTPQLSQLLWRHYRWHLVVGLAIWTGLLVVGVLTQYLHEGSVVAHESFYAHNQAEILYHAASRNAGLAFMLLVFGFVPAAIGRLIRLPAMEYLSRRVRSRSELVWKSLFVFEALVFVAALIPWPIAYNRFGAEMVGRQFRIGFLVSLPWLLSTGLASRKLASALVLPRPNNAPKADN